MEERPDRKAMILSFFKTWRQIVQQILCTYQPSYCSFLLFSYRVIYIVLSQDKRRDFESKVFIQSMMRESVEVKCMLSNI